MSPGGEASKPPGGRRFEASEEDVVSLLQENLEQEQHTLREVEKHAERLTQQLVHQTA